MSKVFASVGDTFTAKFKVSILRPRLHETSTLLGAERKRGQKLI